MSIFETIYSLRHTRIDIAKQDIERLHNLSHEEFNRWQEEKRWEMARHHYNNNSRYHQLVGTAFPERWEELPIVEKYHFQADLDDLISRPYMLSNLYVNKTSGSSGTPFVFTKDYYTQARVWAARKLFWQEHGLTFSSNQAMFYRKATGTKKRVVEKIKDIILNRYRFSATEVSQKDHEKWVQIFREKKFDYMYGYTSAIVLFCRYLIDNHITLNKICPTLKIVIVTAETCTKEDRAIIEKATGLEVRNEYGSADLGIIAYECDEGHLHLIEENLFVETNENDELIITDLFNFSFPLVRYKLGDKAKISSETCPCGNRNRFISNFLGRSNDVVKLKDGREIPGYALYQMVRPVLEKTNLLKEFIIRQTAYDTFVIEMKTTGEIDEQTRLKIEDSVNKFLGTVVNTSLCYNSEIKRPATGKLKHFYSELDHG